MRILLLSDFHLRQEIRVAGIALAGDCHAAIQSLKQYCDFLKPDLSIWAGDIFNVRTTGGNELQLLKELYEAIGLPATRNLVIQGNHDPGDYSISELADRATDISGKTVEFSDTNGKIKVTGLKYVSLDSYHKFLKGANKDLSDPDSILVIHGECSAFANFEENNIKPSELPDNLFTVIGHVHKSVLVQKDRTVISTGALFPNNKEELVRADSTGAFIYDTETKDFTKLNLYRRPVYDLTKSTKVLEEIRSIVLKEKDSVLPPVAFIDASASSLDAVGRIVIIPVVAGTKEQVASEDSINTGLSFTEKLSAGIVQVVGEKDPDLHEVSAITSSLMYAENPEPVLLDFIKSKIGGSNEANA